MAPKKGCKTYNVDGLGGRPRKYDLDKEAQDLLEWSKYDSSFTLKDFTNDKEYCAYDLNDFAKLNHNFSLALKKAKERIAKRREEACNDGILNYGIFNRYASMYDRDLYRHEDDIKNDENSRKMSLIKYEYDLKMQQTQQATEELQQKFDALMSQISSAQSNAQESKSKTEHKS